MHDTSFKSMEFQTDRQTLVVGILLNTPGASSSCFKEMNRQTNIPVVCICLVERCLSILILSAATLIFGIHVNKAISIRNIRIQATSFKQKFGLSISLLTVYVFHVQKIAESFRYSPSLDHSNSQKTPLLEKLSDISRCGHLECDDIWSFEMSARAEGYGTILTIPTGR
jgi:hypothetical protein